ncbi:LysR family transcriptional regulator [Rhizobium sp. ARZ01]|uniref:LysR substrate-binding domain-containing protein n=1 Tax=Rhizobium sp. ARZ01 TaxID=2769313 RepID=UPI0017800D6B|nr:LysR substrate-binding domain-containing protein [Rhizobium sp. ARZ01]MBD9375699.1 LysR family transcriptional regulator [Rhizobium sp. ARZ01]
MNVRQLEAFRAVMSCRSVSGAAQMLNVSQPAISQQITMLEQSCRFSLFERVKNRLHPTREAAALLVEVNRIFDGLNRVSRVTEALRQQKWGAISVGSFPAIGKRILPRMIASYISERPDLEFHLQSMRSISLIDAVAAQQMDVGVSFLPGDREEIESIHIKSVKAVCILPSGHALASKAVIHARDLEGEKFISLGKQDRARMQIDKVFSDFGVIRHLQIETGQSDAAIALVGEKVGVSVIDPFSAHDFPTENVLVRRFEPKIEFGVWLLRSKLHQKSTLIEGFVDFLKSGFAAMPATDD